MTLHRAWKPSAHPMIISCNAICDLCNKPRNRGNHDKCSKKRQAMRRAIDNGTPIS